MAQHGGYRQPNNPAPVSGPGSLSQRTDGGAVEGMTPPQAKTDWTGLPYGENKTVNDQQSGAPLAGNTLTMPDVVPLTAPTQLPDQPLSHGANWGEGPGVDTSGIRSVQAPDPASVIYRMMQTDSSGQLEAIYNRINLS